MVGGWGNCDPVCTFLDTTEVFTSSSGSWRLISAALPSAIQGGYVATVSNIVFMLGDITITRTIFTRCYNAGGYDGTDAQDDIFQYEPDDEEWEHVGNLMNARNSHAVSIVDINDINNHYCIVSTN